MALESVRAVTALIGLTAARDCRLCIRARSRKPSAKHFGKALGNQKWRGGTACKFSASIHTNLSGLARLASRNRVFLHQDRKHLHLAFSGAGDVSFYGAEGAEQLRSQVG